jgi:glutathione peroxidase
MAEYHQHDEVPPVENIDALSMSRPLLSLRTAPTTSRYRPVFLQKTTILCFNDGQTHHLYRNDMTTIHDFTANSLIGTPVDLAQYRGKVVLIVNTASECGFTPQYKGLEELYREFKDKGVEVLGFPCNQFGKQEPGSAEEIGAFCKQNYGVSFPMFAKIDVNGDKAHPLYKFLKDEKPGILGIEAIKWNFTKFLIRKDGTVFKRYAPQTAPKELVGDVEKLLAE